MSTLVKRLVNIVMAHEGNYDSVNRNTDGAGASIGIFQWPQRTGGILAVLHGYYEANPPLFVQIFGPSGKSLLHMPVGSMAPIDGAYLWQEPWVSRFVLAGRQPVFQAVQDRLTAEGEYIKAAFSAANLLGFVTERSLAVMLDAAVSQGPQFAVNVARDVRRLLGGQTLPMRQVLEEYLRRSSAHFHSFTQPPPSRKPHMSWKQINNEWHKYAGQVNLYRNIQKRRGGLIQSAALSDAAITHPEITTA